jgi:hypothetical protein
MALRPSNERRREIRSASSRMKTWALSGSWNGSGRPGMLASAVTPGSFPSQMAAKPSSHQPGACCEWALTAAGVVAMPFYSTQRPRP